ncbi:hypothetical protein [Marinobacter sp. LV10R510-11A]|uniref:hypothetical protein n=1 Tax=Marinobacter sp. LV10R510-11A TaxID=1415568 RepID=UPI001064208E|nr:hypothetical protein [Marinobacter sp. LV10R510-11A]
MPGEDNQGKIRPGDPVIVYFSEPVLPSSVTADTCVGGKSSDDRIPDATHPSNKPLVVRFSQNMDPTTITAGGRQPIGE